MMFLSALRKKVFQPTNTLSLIPLVLIIPIILFEALSIAGCASTSPGIPDIFVVSLVPATANTTANTTTTPDFSVRIGFFGICATDPTGSTRCQSSARSTLPSTLVANLFPLAVNTTSERDALALSETALALQSRILASPLAGCVLLFGAGVAFLLLFRHEKARHVRQGAAEGGGERRRYRWSRSATYVCLWLHAALLFAAALAATTTMNALEFVSSAPGAVEIVGGGLDIQRGMTMMVLQWMAFGFSVVFTLAVPVVVRPEWMLVAMYSFDSKVGA